MLENIFLILFAFYFLQSFLSILGIRKKFKRIPDSEFPSVAVIVAARDEEDNILRCLESLDQLVYPEHLLEIVIVDDNSRDKTHEIISEFIKNKPKFKCIKPKTERSGLKGKTNAIANAIAETSGEIILTTDADCVVPPDWVKVHASYYTEETAMVCGYTTQWDDKAFYGMQAYDFVYLQGVAAGTMNLGKPMSCIGNNMSYRRSVYEEVGGYENIPFSVTEDFQLLMAFQKLGRYKIIYPFNKKSLVVSKPCDNLKSIYKQKKRWGVGGLAIEFTGYFMLGTAFIVHGLVLASPFLMTPSIAIVVFSKFVVDLFFLYYLLKALGRKFSFKNFIAFEIYFLIYVFLLPFQLVIHRRVEWKGRRY